MQKFHETNLLRSVKKLRWKNYNNFTVFSSESYRESDMFFSKINKYASEIQHYRIYFFVDIQG